MRVVEISQVESVGYDPAEQRLQALVRDAAGNPAHLSAAYHPLCPGALDAPADALHSGPRYLSGSLHRAGGHIVIDPVAVLTSDGLTVPDLAPASTPLPSPAPPPRDPLTTALDDALGALARHDDPATADAWLDAQLHLVVCAELHREHAPDHYHPIGHAIRSITPPESARWPAVAT